MQEVGALLQEDYFANVGGINNTDSPFSISPGQAANGRNYEYAKTGAFKKRAGAVVLNSSPDTALRTIGIALRETIIGTKTNIRCADTRIQSFVYSSGACTNLTDDTVSAASAFFTSGSTQMVSKSMFSNTSADILWLAGGGASTIYGVASTTKVTANGSSIATGAISTSVGGSGGAFLATGTYYYSVALRKTSTLAISNCALDKPATVAATTQKVTIDLSALTSLDTTKYDKIYIYRSVVSGVTAFTAGDLIAQAASTSTSYVDDGTYITTATNVPRSGNTLLDNTVIPTDTYKYITTFKRRLVTVGTNNVVYISDTNKSESWPLHNYITLPSGSPVTGVAVISFITPTSSSIDEFLVIFKEDEMWVITGTGSLTSSVPDWQLKLIDKTGCSSHHSIVFAQGFLYWINNRGFFAWDGAGKPIYISRLIEDYFAADGDIDRSKLSYVWGDFFNKQNEIIWIASHKIYGEQYFGIKLDLRLTLPQVTSQLGERIVDGVFVPDSFETPLYAGSAFKPNGESDTQFMAGNATGYIYKRYTQTSDNTTGISFEYITQFLNQGSLGKNKYYHKVIVWVEEIGSWNLTLTYWTNYKSATVDQSQIQLPISTADQTRQAYWDVAYWDVAYWDTFASKPKPLVFNLRGVNNNISGDCIKLAFSQSGVDQPVTIYGFSIIYSEAGANK